ncbi:flagellar biosynthesis protein FlhF [Alkalispirochaeta americana]|uniref:Flagellar biosynthesis protein FlhF n=1 Tax=Alkalispirochaeta americana TaxID=159291 RepID=A0A1N6PN07_9SPIO|nr:flagellar biosynthesis protein FlhF [Alkalispirochaeta americana]SIQ05589.1 flagellar biosynthesis protein FlhF [Alkalispirochaeta americana]
MDYFVEQAPTDQEVHAIIRQKYGDRARILARKEIRVGGILGLFRRTAVEVTGYCSHAPQAQKVVTRGSVAEERSKILEQVLNREGTGGAARGNPREKPAGPSSAGGESMESVLSEIRALRDTLVHQGSGKGGNDPPALQTICDVLEENDFSPVYIRKLVDSLRRDCTLDQLSDTDHLGQEVVARIKESISIYPWQERRRSPHVFVLVGPTGVGKTTTIAKLAAMYGAVADPPFDVRILTIDTYRIGALQQIQKYGEIMNIPVHAVESVGDMKNQLALHQDADFIFVDTIGKSPNDFGKLAEVNHLVQASGGEVHLAVSATTKRSDMEEILRQFEPFHYQAVVVTKIDETACVGGIISALKEKQKSVSFLTDGQSVPQDIERARLETFLRRLKDLPGGPAESSGSDYQGYEFPKAKERQE